jgi:hypothetical protein
MDKERKFEPDPFTKGYIDYLDKSPIKFDNLNHQIEIIRTEQNLSNSELM